MTNRFWFALFMIIGFSGGWFVNHWRRDSIELALQRAIEQSTQDVVQMASQAARQLEAQLQEVRQHEFKQERIVRTEVIKPVFTHVCASDEFVRMFNASTRDSERILSGEHVTEVRDAAADTTR